MLKQDIENRRYNLNIVCLTLTLLLIGVINLYSATYGIEIDQPQYWKTQTYRFFLYIVLASPILFFHYRIMERFSYLVYAINVLLLLGVLIMGDNILGSKRWINLGLFVIQPSEFMKITIIWILAKYFSADKSLEPYSLGRLTVPIVLVAIPVLLVALQPDLGTAIILLAIATSIFLFVNIKHQHLIALLVLGVACAPIAYKFALKDYQRQRIKTFLNPQADPRGAGYNAIQSMVAVGSGKFLGKGFTNGTQSQLKFLPEHHTDFIFSVLAEEHGLVGALFLLMLFLLFLFQGIKVAHESNDKFAMLFSIGIVMFFFFHIFVNLGMSMGILPVVGVPLPFMSYGGSFLLTCVISVLILFNISSRKPLF